MQKKIIKRQGGMKRISKMITFALFCLLTQLSLAQQNVVEGTVTDQNGNPLLGVNVIQKILVTVRLQILTETFNSMYLRMAFLYLVSLDLKLRKLLLIRDKELMLCCLKILKVWMKLS